MNQRARTLVVLSVADSAASGRQSPEINCTRGNREVLRLRKTVLVSFDVNENMLLASRKHLSAGRNFSGRETLDMKACPLPRYNRQQTRVRTYVFENK